MNGRGLPEWLQDEHPAILKDLLEEIQRGLGQGEVRLDSFSAMEAWLERHHPAAYKEWKATQR
jgi:hypothetical protein